jgi:hypothetical protein
LAKTVHYSRSADGNIIVNLARAKLTQGIFDEYSSAHRVHFGSNDTIVGARQRFSRLSAWMMLNQTGTHILNHVKNCILNGDYFIRAQVDYFS